MIASLVVLNYLSEVRGFGLTTAELGIIVTVLLFATAHLIMLLKWGSNLERSTSVLATRMETLSRGLEKVENAIALIADVNIRFNYLEKIVSDNAKRSIDRCADHESRLRDLEAGQRAACGHPS